MYTLQLNTPHPPNSYSWATVNKNKKYLNIYLAILGERKQPFIQFRSLHPGENITRIILHSISANRTLSPKSYTLNLLKSYKMQKFKNNLKYSNLGQILTWIPFSKETIKNLHSFIVLLEVSLWRLLCIFFFSVLSLTKLLSESGLFRRHINISINRNNPDEIQFKLCLNDWKHHSYCLTV